MSAEFDNQRAQDSSQGCPFHQDDSAKVQFDPTFNRWLILDYDNAAKLLKSSDFYHDLAKATPESSSHAFLEFLSQFGDEHLLFLFQDAPSHTHLRSALAPEFTPKEVETKRAHIKNVAQKLLASLKGQQQFDLISAYTNPFSTQVITDMLGVEPSDWARYLELSNANHHGFDVTLTEMGVRQTKAAQEELRQIFQESILQRRSNPKDDLISKMILDPVGFSDHKIAMTCQFLLRAGSLTSSDLIGNAIYALLTHPTELDKLKNNPALISDVVEETLRFDSSALEAGRITARPIEVDNKTIPQDQTVMISLDAANHDASQFNDPNTFNITRTNKQHLSFGGGPHFCLGAALARAEAQIAISTLLEAFSTIELDVKRPSQRHNLPSFRGFASLHVKV